MRRINSDLGKAKQHMLVDMSACVLGRVLTDFVNSKTMDVMATFGVTPFFHEMDDGIVNMITPLRRGFIHIHDGVVADPFQR